MTPNARHQPRGDPVACRPLLYAAVGGEPRCGQQTFGLLRWNRNVNRVEVVLTDEAEVDYLSILVTDQNGP